MSNYFDFDPWGMAGNSWGSANNWSATENATHGLQDWGDMLNIGAKTSYEPMDMHKWGQQDFDSPPMNFGNTLSGMQSQSPGQTSGGLGSLSFGTLGQDIMNYGDYLSPSGMFGQSVNPMKESLESGYWGNNPLTLGSQPTAMSNPNYADAAKAWSPFDIGEGGSKGWLESITGFAKKNPELLRLGTGLYGAYKQNQAKKMYEDLAKKMVQQQNPYASQYAAKHYDYFQNPGKWMQSPMVQELHKQASQEYMRNMAAQGRTNPNEIGYTNANMLRKIGADTYTDWMKSSYPWGQVDPSTNIAAAGMQEKANQAKWNQYNGLLEGLLRMTGVPQSEVGTHRAQPTKGLDQRAKEFKDMMGWN